MRGRRGRCPGGPEWSPVHTARRIAGRRLQPDQQPAMIPPARDRHDPPAVRGGRRRQPGQDLAGLRGRVLHLRPGPLADRERGGRPGRARRRPRSAGAGHGGEPAGLCVQLAGVRLPRRDHGCRKPARQPGRDGRAGGPGAAAAGRHRRRRAGLRRAGAGGRSGGGCREPGRLAGRPRLRARLGPGRRSGGADPHIRHHRPLQAGHPDPARLRAGGGGFSVVDGAWPGRPADDLAAAVSRQRPHLLDARLGGRRRQPGAAAAVLGQHLHRLRPPPRRHRVQRHRRHAGDPHAPAASGPTTPTTRCACATPGRRPASSASWRSSAASGCASCAATHFREPLRHHLAAGHAAVWDAGQRPPAPAAGHDQRGPGDADDGAGAGRGGGGAATAKSGGHARLLEHA